MRLAAVTGSAGHLGRLLCAALYEAGYRVRGLYRTRPNPAAYVEAVPCDVRDGGAVAQALAGADVVFHLAARISLDARDADEMYATQVDGTRAVIAARPRRLIHVASIHAYDPQPIERAVDESRPLAIDESHFAYDRSKALGARLVLDAIDAGLDATVVSPTALIGPDDPGPSDMGALFRRLLRRELPGLVSADFDWVDARDVAAALVRIADGAPSRHYVLPGHRASLVELGTKACALGGVRPPVLRSPLWLAKATMPLVGAWAKVMNSEPLYTSASLSTLGRYKHIDGSRAARELDWAPRPLDATLADTVAWWRVHL